MHISSLSSRFAVRRLDENDVQIIYDLSVQNPLFYQFCPPAVTVQSIIDDMKALPPQKGYEDKLYVGFLEKEKLVAIMDLILKFPNDETAFIGLFMMNKAYQSKGIGTHIINEICNSLKTENFKFVRLAFAKGNPQSEAFWLKNGFKSIGKEVQKEGYTTVITEKAL